MSAERLAEIREQVAAAIKAAYRHGYGAGASAEASEKFDPEGAADAYLNSALPTLTARTLDRVEKLEEFVDAARDAHAVMKDTEEINPSNYDHDLVCQLNAGMNEAYGILDTALRDLDTEPQEVG